MAALLVPGAGWANEPPCCRDCGEIHVSERLRRPVPDDGAWARRPSASSVWVSRASAVR